MNETITAKVKEYADMKKMMNELQDLMDALEADIKAAMGDSEEMSVEGIKITWKTVTSSRFDSTAFKKAMPELAERFTRSTTSRRFVVA